MGYTQEQIDVMDAESNQERVQETNIGAELIRNFNAGTF